MSSYTYSLQKTGGYWAIIERYKAGETTRYSIILKRKLKKEVKPLAKEMELNNHTFVDAFTIPLNYSF